MDKERLFVVISLCFLLATDGLCQKFNYNSQKKQNSEYNVELSNALRDDDCPAIERILSKNPSLVDAASSGYVTAKHLKVITVVPLICDAVQRCLDGQCSVKMVETILSYHPNLNCKSNGLPPFYIVLKYISCHKISECGRAEELFFTFLNKSNIDIKERPADLPPSFSYLLTENYNFLKGHFSREYISPEIIKAFVDKGASINTNDVNSNSILSFATLTQNQELIDYCLGSGANVTSTNKEGKDAFYYAVANKDYEATKSILESGYPLSESRLVSMKMQQPIAQAGSNIQVLLYERLKTGKKNMENIRTLFDYFPNQRSRYLSDGFNRADLDVAGNQLPEFIDMFASLQLDRTGARNLEALKKEYVAGSKNLGAFGAALKKYPIVTFHYSDKYYENESSYNTLLSELQSLKNTLSSNLIDRLSQEAIERQNKFVSSDWKRNPSVGKKVADGYPYMYDKVVAELYGEIAGMSVKKTNYSNEHYSYSMKDELGVLGRQIQYCDDFISCFGNSSYGSQAREKRTALYGRRNYVQEEYDNWLISVRIAKNRLQVLRNYVLEKGKTPHYKTRGEWENVGGEGFFGVFSEDKYRIYFSIDLGFTEIWEGNLFQGEKSKEYTAWVAGGTSFSETKNPDLAIREAVWVYCYEDRMSDDDIINLVEYLEKNKDGEWWKRGYR